MENKNKSISIIVGTVIIVVIAIIGVSIYFTSKSIIKNNEANNTSTESNGDNNIINQGIQDNPEEDNLANIIATPNNNEGDSSPNFQATP